MKTAVEWLEDNLTKRLYHLSNHKVHIKEFVRTAKCAEIRKMLEVIEQAKQMEKEQIINGYLKGYLEEIPNPSAMHYYEDVAAQYYNETFKSE